MADIVKDSSIWESGFDFEAVRKKDMSVRVGIIREAKIDVVNDDINYIVEVFNSGNQMPVFCKRLERFGGAYNYEEFTHRGYTHSKATASEDKYSVRAGDIVIVAFIRGDSREGVILGSIKHPSRKRKTDKPTDVLYLSEFNGIETSINTSGELKVTFKGIPTNITELIKPPTGNDISAPTYDTAVGSSYYQLDKTGSWLVNDNAQSNPQSIKIDKPGGTLTITSGQAYIKIDKNAQLITIINKDTVLNSANSIKETTKDYSIDATATYKLRSPKIAIGMGGTELLDQITKLIDAVGMLTAISPLGPCAPLTAAPQWSGVTKVKSAISGIKGSL